MKDDPPLTDAQRSLGDMEIEEFRSAAHEVADRVADYLKELESYRILPTVEPGDIRDRLPDTPPAAPEPLDKILDDYATLIQPNITHWQHPGFMAYFASVASGPGILGEWLATGLNSNVMFWRNAPASTELEERVVEWLRQMLGLPPAFDGMFTDTASISSLLAITVARHSVPGLDSRSKGLAGRPDTPRLRLYTSAEAHLSVDKSAIVTGVGTEGVRRIAVDDDYRMRPDELARAIEEDRRNGWLPYCVVGTMGTTSSTSIDPAEALAEICEREGLWFHIDAAYGGAGALVPELRGLYQGWERADSIVFNPHKWMFTPFDASLLLFRKPERFREAFSIVHEYIKTPVSGGAHNYNEYGVQLGRRFRALKLWMQIRYFGAEGIADRIRGHRRMAELFASWVDGAPGWELLAPVPLSTVCFRYHPDSIDDDERLDSLNEKILAKVNTDARIFLSHTKLRDRFTLRVSLGNLRTTERHLELCWELLREAAAAA
jgi:aromatic-L-amino-acid decarboxylase